MGDYVNFKDGDTYAATVIIILEGWFHAPANLDPEPEEDETPVDELLQYRHQQDARIRDRSSTPRRFHSHPRTGSANSGSSSNSSWRGRVHQQRTPTGDASSGEIHRGNKRTEHCTQR
ncbi:hypothetical protein FCM35_KLT17490 [Carex littledalei]|uniref:Uncharacterized protein n=1 Tax=Carex littledalei TaxID=544730 RepID=A0A833VWQ8_9POAL|nr:hypothetical protein FCM35_KLT17490 [Carex littledalei]